MPSAHIFCSNCGVKNQKDAGFCFNCGSQLARPEAAANTLQTPANIAGSGQQVSAPLVRVSAPLKPVTESPLAQGTNPTITSLGESNTSGINSATGFLLIIGTGNAWYEYFGYHYTSSGYYVYYDYYDSGFTFMGSIVLLLGLFILYTTWTKNLSIISSTSITSKRKTIARVGVFLGCILLSWGIWGWVHASPYNYSASSYNGVIYLSRYFNSSYIYPTLGFAFIALTGIFIILATTTKSFGLSHTKSKKEMAQRTTTLLATFILVFGTTFLLPDVTIVAAILCFLIGGGVLIATQWRQ